MDKVTSQEVRTMVENTIRNSERQSVMDPEKTIIDYQQRREALKLTIQFWRKSPLSTRGIPMPENLTTYIPEKIDELTERIFNNYFPSVRI
jgi:hypothetical protein